MFELFINSFKFISNKIFTFPIKSVYALEDEFKPDDFERKISEEDINIYINQQTGLDRLKEMFSQSKDSQLSPQLELVFNTMAQTGITFAVFTSVFGGISAREKFLRKTQHKSYTTKFIAVRGYNDATLFGALRFGLKYGIKASLFSGIYMLTSQMISVYKNKSGIIEHAVAGGFTFGILRINGGLKGFVGAGSIGCFLGLVSGIVMNLIMKSVGYSQEQLNIDYVREKLHFVNQLDN